MAYTAVLWARPRLLCLKLNHTGKTSQATFLRKIPKTLAELAPKDAKDYDLLHLFQKCVITQKSKHKYQYYPRNKTTGEIQQYGVHLFRL